VAGEIFVDDVAGEICVDDVAGEICVDDVEGDICQVLPRDGDQRDHIAGLHEPPGTPLFQGLLLLQSLPQLVGPLLLQSQRPLLFLQAFRRGIRLASSRGTRLQGPT